MTDIYSKPLMVDPPRGYLYVGSDGQSFPRLYDPTKEEGTMRDWLIRNGYPQSEIDKYGEYFHCRFWYPEEKATDTLNNFFGENKQKTEDFHERFNEPS